MSPYGRLVIGGFVFEIKAMCILNAKLHIEAGRDGPLPAMTGLPVTIFGADSRGFLQGGSVSVEETPVGYEAAITVDIALERCE